MKKGLNSMKKPRRTWKKHLFSAYQYIIEHNIVGSSTYFAMILLEFLQLHYLPFVFPDSSAEDSYENFKTAFKGFGYGSSIFWRGFALLACTFLWLVHVMLCL
jgi:hypothetical protein